MNPEPYVVPRFANVRDGLAIENLWPGKMIIARGALPMFLEMSSSGALWPYVIGFVIDDGQHRDVVAIIREWNSSDKIK